MFRIWGRLIRNNHLLKDVVVSPEGKDMSRTAKVYKSVEMICEEFDLAVPIWHDNNNNEFIKHSMTRFYPVSFLEAVDFDYLEIKVIEEDHIWE